MPFELNNTETTFQKTMDKILKDQIGRNLEVYVDDILVKSRSNENHIKNLEETFQKLK